MINQISFTNNRVKVRQLFICSTMLLALLGLIAGLMFFSVGERLFGLIQIFSGLALVIFLLGLAFLLFYYITCQK
jgi:hypothetical protein